VSGTDRRHSGALDQSQEPDREDPPDALGAGASRLRFAGLYAQPSRGTPDIPALGGTATDLRCVVTTGNLSACRRRKCASSAPRSRWLEAETFAS